MRTGVLRSGTAEATYQACGLRARTHPASNQIQCQPRLDGDSWTRQVPDLGCEDNRRGRGNVPSG
jgi:hypothetical protein